MAYARYDMQDVMGGFRVPGSHVCNCVHVRHLSLSQSLEASPALIGAR